MWRSNIKRIKLINGAYFLISLIIYVLMGIISWRQVMNQYEGVCDKKVLVEYMKSVYIIAGFVLTVFIICWCVLTICNNELRENCEKNSGKCILGVTLFLLFISAAFFWTGCGSVRDNNEDMHTLLYIFIFPLVFGGNMYLFTPINIKEVVLPTRLPICRFLFGGVFWIFIALCLCFSK